MLAISKWLNYGRQGMTPKEIAGRLGLSSRTVQKWLAAGTLPEVRERRKKSSSFDAFAPFVLKGWKEGEHKGVALYREIKAQGYTGSDRSVYRSLATFKQTEMQAPESARTHQEIYAKHGCLAVCP
jgi:transposase